MHARRKIPNQPAQPAERRILVAVVAESEEDRAALSTAFTSDRRHRVVNSGSFEVTEAALARGPVDAIVGFVDDDASWRRFRAIAHRYPDTLSVLLVSDPDDIDGEADGHVLNAVARIHRKDLSKRAAEVTNSIEQQLNVQGTDVHLIEPSERERLEQLTPRELEVLALTADGLSMKEIARRLNRAYGTVATHRTSIMTKLDLHDKVALTRLAIRAGLTSV